MLQFDVLFNDLGEIGLAQVIFVLIIGSTTISSGINSLSTLFIAYEPDYRCNVPYFDKNRTNLYVNESMFLNLTTPFNSVTNSYERCNRYNYNISLCQKDAAECFNASYHTISCDKGYHYDQSLFSETVVTEFNLVCENKHLKILSVSLYYAGFAFGAILFGNLGDRIGRKKCVLIAYLGALICMVGMTMTTSIYLFLVFRFGAATFLFGSTDNAYTYVTEILGKRWRAKFSFWIHIAFALGYLILVGIAYKWRNYHDIMLAITIFSTPFLFLLFLLPESPRWLFTQNRNEEGIRVVNKIARINRVQVHEKTWKEAKRAAEENNDKAKIIIETKFSSLDLFKSWKIAIMTMKIMFLWFVCSAVYYGVSFNSKALAGDIFLNNLYYCIFELASYVLCIVIIDRFGRATIQTFFLMLTGVAFACSLIINAFANENQTLIALGTFCVFIARSGIGCSFATIFYITAELFPTVVRTNALGVGSVSARIAGILAPFVVYLQDIAGWLPNVTFCVLSILAGLLSLTLPETSGHVMMETIEEAENFYSDKKRRKKKHFKMASLHDITIDMSDEETVQL